MEKFMCRGNLVWEFINPNLTTWNGWTARTVYRVPMFPLLNQTIKVGYISTAMAGLNYYADGKFKLIEDNTNLKTKNIASLKFFPKTQSLFIGTDFGFIGNETRWQYELYSTARVWQHHNFVHQPISRFTFADWQWWCRFCSLQSENKAKRVVTPKDGLSSGFVFLLCPMKRQNLDRYREWHQPDALEHQLGNCWTLILWIRQWFDGHWVKPKCLLHQRKGKIFWADWWALPVQWFPRKKNSNRFNALHRNRNSFRPRAAG